MTPCTAYWNKIDSINCAHILSGTGNYTHIITEIGDQTVIITDSEKCMTIHLLLNQLYT